MNIYDIRRKLGKMPANRVEHSYGELLGSSETIHRRIAQNNVQHCLAIQDNRFKLTILAEYSEDKCFRSIYLGPMS